MQTAPPGNPALTAATVSRQHRHPAIKQPGPEIGEQYFRKPALKLNQRHRLGMAKEEAQAVLIQLDSAIESVLARLADDARFTGDGLLERVRAAIHGPTRIFP